MLYILSVMMQAYDSKMYHMFETNTESKLVGDVEYVRKLVNECKMKPKNMTVNNNGLQINIWPHSVRKSLMQDCPYILLGKRSEQKFKLVQRISGDVFYFDAKQLMYNIDTNCILNCSKELGEYKSIDICKLSVEKEFKQLIKKKIEVFRAKSALLGIDIDFDYSIEDRGQNTKIHGTKQKSNNTKLCNNNT